MTKNKSIILEALGEASSLFMSQPLKGTEIVMPSKELNAIADRAAAQLGGEQYEHPMLGLATTRELLDELWARIEVDGKLDYRTVDS